MSVVYHNLKQGEDNSLDHKGSIILSTWTYNYRISYVVGKACVKVWATKIHTQLQTCVYEVKKTIKETGTKKERTYRSEQIEIVFCIH